MDESATTEKIQAALEAVGELVLPLTGESMGSGWSRAEGIKVFHVQRRAPRWGDVVLFERHGRIYAHRLILRVGSRCWTKGDARVVWDRPTLRRDDLFGVAVGRVGHAGDLTPVPRSRVTALRHLLLALVAWPFLFARRRICS